MNKYIYQIKAGEKAPVYRTSTGYENKAKLEKELLKRGYNVKLTNRLKGGVDSQVYSGELEGKSIVVKHTEDRGNSVYSPPFSEIDFFVPRENHNLDTQILKKLEKTDIRVPTVLAHFPDITTTLMENLNGSGFRLMSDLILDGSLPPKSAEVVANQIAMLSQISRKWPRFKCYKTPEAQIFERGLELRLTDPNNQKDYFYLAREFLSNQNYWLWPDGHPKNMFIDNYLNVAFIDFGGSYWGDERFVLPNFLGQFIVLSSLKPGMKKFTVNYAQNLVNTYKKNVTDLDECLLCKYTGMEILHRAFGKWIYGVNNTEQKLRNIKFGLSIFDLKIEKIDDLLYQLNREV